MPRSIQEPYRSLHVRCRECGGLMFVHKDNADVVYCDCEGFTPPKLRIEEDREL